LTTAYPGINYQTPTFYAGLYTGISPNLLGYFAGQPQVTAAGQPQVNASSEINASKIAISSTPSTWNIYDTPRGCGTCGSDQQVPLTCPSQATSTIDVDNQNNPNKCVVKMITCVPKSFESVQTQTMPVVTESVSNHSNSVSMCGTGFDPNTKEPFRSRSFCRKIVSVSNNDQKHFSVSIDQNEVQKCRSVRSYVVRLCYTCVYCSNLSYYRARHLKRNLCTIHGKSCDTLVQGSLFPAINSVLRNATVEEMNKYLGFLNQPLLNVLPTPEIQANAHASVHNEEILPIQIHSSILESTPSPAKIYWKRRIVLVALTDATEVNREVCLIKIPSVIEITVCTIVD